MKAIRILTIISFIFLSLGINAQIESYSKKEIKELEKKAKTNDNESKKKLAEHYLSIGKAKKAVPLLEYLSDIEPYKLWAHATLYNYSLTLDSKEASSYINNFIYICKEINNGESNYYLAQMNKNVLSRYKERGKRYALKYSLPKVKKYLYYLNISAQKGYEKAEVEYNKAKNEYLEYGKELYDLYKQGHMNDTYSIKYLNILKFDREPSYFDIVEWYYTLMDSGIEEAKILFDKNRKILRNGVGNDNGSLQVPEVFFSDYKEWVNSVVIPWYKDKANNNEPEAMYYLAWFSEYVDIFTKDEIYEYFKKSAEAGHAPAQYEYANILKKNNLMYDAFDWYLKSAQQTYAPSANAVGDSYFNGLGIEKDERKALQWYHYAAELGCDEAKENLEKLYKEGKIQNSFATWYASISNPDNISSPLQIAEDVPEKPIIEKDYSLDKNIPVTNATNANTFAVIIGNENYQRVSKVEFALNDAKIFAEYCQKTLGLPKNNIRSYTDATYGTMMTALDDIAQISKAYNGNINVIFYYAGHGVPDESTRNAFLLPVDVDGSKTNLCLSVGNLYSKLNALNARQVTVFMDACFSGSQRGDGMLASARGVALKVKDDVPQGNMVVFSAATGDQTAFPFKEKGHGMFTYYLLKKLCDTKGDVTLGDIANYVTEQVSQQSVVVNGRSQTPTVTTSSAISTSWKEIKLK